MKISCGACGASYSIADEKVRGKTVRVKCKKCSNLIVINPSDVSAVEEWSVSVDDGEPKIMPLADLLEQVRTGKIPADAYLWKEGMDDWKAVSDVPEVATALPPKSAGMLFGGPGGARGSNLIGGRSPAQSQPDARTRVAPPAAAPPAADADASDKMIGARNDTSVLFSLAAVAPGAAKASPATSAAKPAPAAPAPTAAATEGDASGLIDMRVLAGMKGNAPPAKKTDRIDDIMNLGGAPLFAPAPLLEPPPVDTPPPPPEPSPRRPVAVASPASSADMGPTVVGATTDTAPAKAKGGKMILVVGAVAGVVALGGVLFVMNRDKGEGAEAAAAETTSAEPVASTAPPAAATAAPAASVATGASPATGTNPADLPADVGGADPKKSRGGDKRAAEPGKREDAPKTAAAAPPPAEAAPPPKAAPEKPAAAAPAAAAGDGGEFDRGAALSALGSVAGAAASCKTADGPTGSGRVSVTFAPSGNATQAAVDGPPFAGTPVGGCIAAKFRSAKVPPFSGAPVTVKKSFTIN